MIAKTYVKTTANNAPITVAGSLYTPFNDALAVGSIVTIAVSMAKIGVRFNNIQNKDVKVAKPVLIVHPIIFYTIYHSYHTDSLKKRKFEKTLL